MKPNTCIHHPGRIVATHPCQARVTLADGTKGVCGYFPENLKGQHESSPVRPVLSLVTSDIEGSQMQTATDSNATGERETFDTETGEALESNPQQLVLGLDLPVLTQRKGQTPGMTRADATEAVGQAIANMREGDRVTASMKDGGIVVKVQEAWRAEG